MMATTFSHTELTYKIIQQFKWGAELIISTRENYNSIFKLMIFLTSKGTVLQSCSIVHANDVTG